MAGKLSQPVMDVEAESKINYDCSESQSHEAGIPNSNITYPIFDRILLSRIGGKLGDDDLQKQFLEAVQYVESEITRMHYDLLHAQEEAKAATRRSDDIEAELNDLRSAAALFVSGQEDAVSTIRRHYDEELASIRSISEQQVAEVRAAVREKLDHERNKWEDEKQALIAQVNANSHPWSKRSKATVAAPVLTTASDIDQGSQLNNNVRVGRGLANQALDTMNQVARRVSLKVLAGTNSLTTAASNTMGPSELSAAVSSVSARLTNADAQAHDSLVAYKQEISRLRQQLQLAMTRLQDFTSQTSAEKHSKSDDSSASLDPSPHSTPTHTLAENSQSGGAPPDVLPNTDDPVGDSSSRLEEAAAPPGDASSSSYSSDSTPPLLPPDDESQVLVSKREWSRLQLELQAANRRLANNCEMCQNYEDQMQTLQLREKEQEKKLQVALDESIAARQELTSLRQLQIELESELKTRTVSQSERTSKLESNLSQVHSRLDNLLSNYQAYRHSTEAELERLAKERETARIELSRLETHYNALVSRRSKATAELSEQPIRLPEDKTDLELLALRLYEENISIRAARDHLDERLRSETQFHRQQLTAERQERATLEATLQRDFDEAKARLASLTDVVNRYDREVELRQKAEADLNKLKCEFEALNSKLSSVEEEASNARSEGLKWQKQLFSMQAELDNAESVQADFVRLSQRLQVQLESLRQQDHEVRWMDPEDALACTTCETPFPIGSAGNKRKLNCRHCGKIHCPDCLRKTIPAGPHRRLAAVCEVCHTLLDKTVAPYFSTNSSLSACSKQTGTKQKQLQSPRTERLNVASNIDSDSTVEVLAGDQKKASN